MVRTVPISAGQPLDTTRTAAGQVVTLAAALNVRTRFAAGQSRNGGYRTRSTLEAVPSASCLLCVMPGGCRARVQ
jgi:hypothetical protein